MPWQRRQVIEQQCAQVRALCAYRALQDACELARIATDDHPTSHELWAVRAHALQLSGDREKARYALERALKLAPHCTAYQETLASLVA